MSWYVKVLRNYCVFSGRARRKEHWFFVLFTTIFSIALALMDLALGTYDEQLETGLLTAIYELAVFIPSLAVAVRRLHDTDRRGWWLLLLLIPVIGWIILFVFLVLRGQEGDNRFGPTRFLWSESAAVVLRVENP